MLKFFTCDHRPITTQSVMEGWVRQRKHRANTLAQHQQHKSIPVAVFANQKLIACCVWQIAVATTVAMSAGAAAAVPQMAKAATLWAEWNDKHV
jgi:hypothetical protein